MRTLDVGIEEITHLAFSPDGAVLAATGYGGIGVGPWPASATGRGPFTTTATDERLSQLAWHPDGHLFAVTGLDRGIVQVRDARLRCWKELIGVGGQHGPVLALAFSPDGDRLAFAGGWWHDAALAVVVQTATWRPVWQLEDATDQIGALVFSRPNVLIAGSADRRVTIHVLDKPTAERPTWPLASPVQALALSPDLERLAVAAGNQIHLLPLDAAGWPEIGNNLVCRGHKGIVRSACFAPDGRTLASIGEDGSLRFWDAQSGAPRQSLSLGLGTLRAAAFAPDGLTIVAGGDAGTLAIVDVDA